MTIATVTVEVDLANVSVEELAAELSGRTIKDEIYRLCELDHPDDVETDRFGESSVLEYAEAQGLTLPPPVGSDYRDECLRTYIRNIAAACHIRSDTRARHEVLHDLGLIPALERIEDLLATGDSARAREVLAAFIRPPGAPKLGVHGRRTAAHTSVSSRSEQDHSIERPAP